MDSLSRWFSVFYHHHVIPTAILLSLGFFGGMGFAAFVIQKASEGVRSSAKFDEVPALRVSDAEFLVNLLKEELDDDNRLRHASE